MDCVYPVSTMMVALREDHREGSGKASVVRALAGGEAWTVVGGLGVVSSNERICKVNENEMF